MSENRDFAWLRKVLCDEIEAVRSGTADHTRAKSVAALAAVALKSVEVEATMRQQIVDLKDAPALGALPLYEIPVFVPPAIADKPAPENDQPEQPLKQGPDIKGIKAPIELTEVNGFKVSDRVFLPNGKHGTVRSVTTSGRIDVEHDNGGVFPYQAKQISHASAKAPPIKSPIVPQGPVPRFVAGRNASGSREG